MNSHYLRKAANFVPSCGNRSEAVASCGPFQAMCVRAPPFRPFRGDLVPGGDLCYDDFAGRRAPRAAGHPG
jgi:hypothetical protein